MVSTSDGEPYGLPAPSLSFPGHGRITLAGEYNSHFRFLPLRFFLFNLWQVLADQDASVLKGFSVIYTLASEQLAHCGESPPSHPISEIPKPT